jgi:gliding motility-associated-like protein
MNWAIRSIIIVVFAVFWDFETRAQKIDWIKQLGGTGYENTFVTVDKDGSSIVCVLFTRQFLADDINFQKSPGSDYGGGILKIDSAGNLIWVKQLEDIPHRAGVDTAGNIYVLQSSQFRNFFLAKYTEAGTELWKKLITTSQYLWYPPQFFDVSLHGDVVLAAYFEAPVTDGDTTSTIVSGSFGVVTFDQSGKLKNANKIELDLNESVGIAGSAINFNGSYAVGGFFTGPITIGSISVAKTVPSLFYAKFSRDGECQWLKTTTYKGDGGVGTHDLSDMVFDVSDNLYVAGTFQNQFAIENLSLTESQSSILFSLFVLKFDQDGELLWLTKTNSDPNYYKVDNVTLGDNNLYISGTYNWGSSLFVLGLDTQSNYLFEDTIHVGWENTSWWPNMTSGGTTPDSKVILAGAFRTRFDSFLTAHSGDLGIDGFLLSWNPRFTKSDPCPAVIGKLEVSGENKFCSSGYLELFTQHQDFIEEYEWKIEKGAATITILTTAPLLSFLPDSLGLRGLIRVRVRGNHSCTSGPLSDFFDVGIDDPLQSVILSQECNTLRAGTSYPVQWLLNDVETSLFGEDEKEISPHETGQYKIVVRNACGESLSNTIYFKPFNAAHLDYYNVITPNDDKFNEFWSLDERLIGSTVQVFDRWGKAVFFSRYYQNNWNGGDLSSGVYFYSIQHKCLISQIRGALTIIR